MSEYVRKDGGHDLLRQAPAAPGTSPQGVNEGAG